MLQRYYLQLHSTLNWTMLLKMLEARGGEATVAAQHFSTHLLATYVLHFATRCMHSVYHAEVDHLIRAAYILVKCITCNAKLHANNAPTAAIDLIVRITLSV